MDMNETELEQPKPKSGFAGGFFCGVAGMLVVVCVAAGVLFGTNTICIADKQEDESGILTDAVTAKVDRLVGEISQYYYEDVETSELVDGLYKGLFASLGDPYSQYYTPEEYEDIKISASAKYYGIGAALQQDKETKKVTVAKVYEGSGAEAAGLKRGDEVVSVEGMTATEEELSDLVATIRGEEGTTVHIEVIREGEEEQLAFDVERGEVHIPTVASKMLEDGVGYIQVSEFAESTPKEFQSAINTLTEQGMKAMMVDLRGNGGGVLTACQKMLDMILPEGVVVYTEDKYGNREDYKSDAEHSMQLPIVVLVNGNSASASEIFAGAIHDFEYGTLIGTKTFGKGIVQNVKMLPDGSAYKLTVSKYYTPNGHNIHGTGIEPDIEVEYEYSGDAAAEEYDELLDSQVLKGLEVLKEQLK